MSDASTDNDYVHALTRCPSPSNTSVILAAKDSGVHRSDDGGVTWVNTFASLASGVPVPALWVDWFASSEGPANVFAGIPGGVVQSQDYGTTWSASQLASPAPIVSAIAISPSFDDDGVILASSLEDGVFRSADRGKKWFAWNFGLVDTRVLCLMLSPNFATDEIVYAGTETGLFTSTNGGRSWAEISTPFGHAAVQAFAAHGIGPTQTMYAATAKGMLASEDQGSSWQQRGTDSLQGSVETVSADPSGRTVVAVAGGQLQISSDAGVSWTPGLRSLEHGNISAAMCSAGSDDGIVVGHVNGEIVATQIRKVASWLQ